MIVSLQGILTESSLLCCVVEAQGIGYEVAIPITTSEKLPPMGETVKLHTLAVYREDAQSIYGFICKEERDFFRLLVEKVSGIGPKIALRILSKLSVQVLKTAIAQSDVALLSQCPGIGKKTAERLVIELRDKVFPGGLGKNKNSANVELDSGSAGIQVANHIQDAIAALMTLGYKLADADKAVRKVQAKLGEDASTEALIKGALG